MTDYAGVLKELVDGSWVEPGTGKQYELSLKDVVINSSLDGAEAELIAMQHQGQSLMVVSDPMTHDALGQRVFLALKTAGMNVREHVWQEPQCSEEGVQELRSATRDAEALIAVGSGTVNDTVKYTSFLDGKTYSVFATSPMNAYTTATASVSFGGFKKSITCHGANGVYFDLSVLRNCPPRLVSAAFADVICRTTAQVDWLMSHIFFETPYTDTPYKLLALYENDMIKNANSMLEGDIDALGALTRIAAIMGLGTSFSETTHSGSMAEHMISHYIDMFAADLHPGTSHGEQVGVATITMSKLQNQILNQASPPVVSASRVPEHDLRERFPAEVAQNLIEQTRAKSLDAAAATRLNKRLESDWDNIRSQLKTVMLPFDELQTAMHQAGCQTTASDINLDKDFYREAVSNARYIRDRYSILDLVDESVGLQDFVSTMPI